MKVNSNYFNLISIEVFVWPLVDLVDLTHILDFSVHPTCVDAVMSGPMDFSMKISPEMKRNATICDIYFKIWLSGKRWPILILHSQTINTNIIHDWTSVKSGAGNSPTKSDTKSVTKVTLNLKEVVVGIMIGNDLWLIVLWLQKISALIKVITH